MNPYLAALDPRIWAVVVAADRVGCKNVKNLWWAPDHTLVADFARRVAALVGPDRVPTPRDADPDRAVLFEPGAYDVVLTRVVVGLWLGRTRPKHARPPASSEASRDFTAA